MSESPSTPGDANGGNAVERIRRTADHDVARDDMLPLDPAFRPEIAREAEERLGRSIYWALRDVSCEVRAGIALLRGHLPGYYLKQVAQAVVGDVEGVRAVVNLIDVVSPSCRPRGGIAFDPQ
jgi:osmotically-inducible protein OsmY